MQTNIELTDPAIFYQSIIDAMPAPVLVVDDDMRIVGFNQTAVNWLSGINQASLMRKTGEVLQCLNSKLSKNGCGHSSFCKDCVIRNAVNSCNHGHQAYRQKVRLQTIDKQSTKDRFYLITANPLMPPESKLTLMIFEDIQEILMMGGLVAICANCKKIRDDDKTWHQIENYLNTELDMDFTHSLCPKCSHDLYPEIYND
jgi:hypothetical protein